MDEVFGDGGLDARAVGVEGVRDQAVEEVVGVLDRLARRAGNESGEVVVIPHRDEAVAMVPRVEDRVGHLGDVPLPVAVDHGVAPDALCKRVPLPVVEVNPNVRAIVDRLHPVVRAGRVGGRQAIDR